jgi:hypothetical protein
VTLRLVHPPPEGQGPRLSKGRRSPALFLTAVEERHLRATIKNTARAYGGMVLASVLGLMPMALNGPHMVASGTFPAPSPFAWPRRQG